MNWIINGVVASILVFAFHTSHGNLIVNDLKVLPGVAGVGNTGNSSLLFNQARNASVQILRVVTYDDLINHTDNNRLVDFYRECRSSMYLGAVETEFEVVEKIIGQGGEVALARRSRGAIQISLEEMNRLSSLGQFTTDLMIAVILHEVGHDCTYDGQAVDDSFDDLLNDLGFTLQQAMGFQAIPEVLLHSFIDRVQNSELVQVLDLPESHRKILLDTYLDYLGDWAFENLSHDLLVRPKSASKFDDSITLAEIPTWSDLAEDESHGVIHQFAKLAIEPSYKRQNFAMQIGEIPTVLPVNLECHARELDQSNAIDCIIFVDLDLPKHIDTVKSCKFMLEFSLNQFGQFEVLKVAIF